MLTTNINVADGLTNGAMGTVTGVVLKQNTLLHVVLVKFDSDKIGCDAKANSKYKHIANGSVPIHKMEVPFRVHKNHHVRVSRTQFPLVLCWAVTIHKCQGMTLPEIVVDMSPDKGWFRDGQAYVAFSHVTALDKLHIINYTREQIHVSHRVHEEISRTGRQFLPMLPVPMISKVDKSCHIVLAHLNISGLLNKVLDIKSDKTLKYADVMCLNETHLYSKHDMAPETLGYDETFVIYRHDRNEHGGGLIMLIRKELNPKQILTFSKVEVSFVQIDTKLGPLYIMSVYRSPTCSADSWIIEMK